MTRLMTREGMLKILRFEVESLFALVYSNELRDDLKAVRGEDHVCNTT